MMGELTDALDAEEVLARLDTGGDGDVHEPLVEEEVVGGPLVGLGVQALLEDLRSTP